MGHETSPGKNDDTEAIAGRTLKRPTPEPLNGNIDLVARLFGLTFTISEFLAYLERKVAYYAASR